MLIPPTVVLVHGLWMTGFEMFLLAHRLKKAGFQCERFPYASTKASIEQNAKKLYEFIAKIKGEEVVVLAHSYGGLVILKMLECCREPKLRKGLLLGSPINGSGLARHLARVKVGRIILGKAYTPLVNGVSFPDTSVVIGAIAGCRNIGPGFLLGHPPEQGDGTVDLAETTDEKFKFFEVVNTTHEGLLFSKEVANLAIDFLALSSDFS